MNDTPRPRFGLFAALASMFSAAILLWGFVAILRLAPMDGRALLLFSAVFLALSVSLAVLIGTVAEALDRRLDKFATQGPERWR